MKSLIAILLASWSFGIHSQEVVSDPNETANQILEIGLKEYHQGNYNIALERYQESLKLFEQVNNIVQQVTILNLIGTLHKKQGDFEKAMEYFQLGYARSVEHGDSLGIGNSTNNMGLVYLQQQDFIQALKFFRESTGIKNAIKDSVGLSHNFDNLGITFGHLEQFDSSRYYFERAAKFKKLTGDEVGYAIVKNNIGEMLLMQGDAKESESFFLEALAVARQTNFKDFEQHILSMLSQVYEAQKKYSEALEYFKLHIAIKDSLFTERKSQQVAELETRYRTEQKEHEIAEQQAEIKQNKILLAGSGGIIALLLVIGLLGRNRLKWKNRQLLEEQRRLAREAEMSAVITSQEKERNRFARDLHDGFGQLISTLNLNLKNIETSKNKDDRHKVFNSSAQVLEEMYQELKNICFDLMPQTLVKHGLEPAIKEFASRINVAGKHYLDVNVFGLNDRLSDLQEISLYRITQEWVNNVIKYSDAQNLTIQITKDDSEITLLIEDDGMGFDKTKLTEGKGNGWRNMNSRTNLINGELELDTTPGLKGNTLIMNAVLISAPEPQFSLA